MPRRLVITKAGSPSVLDVIEMPMPKPKENEVCIEVHFAGINFADTLMRLGLYQPRPPFPFTPGYEVSGIIHSLGRGVKGFEVGQRVVAAMSNGGQASHVISTIEQRKSLDYIKNISSETGCKYTVVDVLDSTKIESLKNEFANEEIKGIAYCVGSIDLKPLRMVKKEDFQKCFDLNFYPIVETIKNFQESLKKNKGSVVIFSTVAVRRGFTNHSIIASVKGALEGLTVSLAAEFAPNIRVNCIAPSLTKSKIAEPMLKNKLIAEGIAKAHPMKRIGEGKDAAAMAKFLLTDESSWITGQIIGVDGGRSKLT